ncbi:MAG: hypothetical protein JWR61_4515 [Ferruginibacter sp.]|nr:hypothetical protein [Ferruginibacter sp.]
MIGYLSAVLPVKEIIFREVEAFYDYDFHNAPGGNTLCCWMTAYK